MERKKMNTKIKKYKHDAAYSYTLGITLTIELIRQKRNSVQKIYVHPDYTVKDESQNIFSICESAGLPCETNSKIFNCLTTKKNTFVLGVFDKYHTPVSAAAPHVVLVNPGDAGNLGTIIRTGIGFHFKDFIVISPGVDFFDPKVIRASMGAFFHGRFAYFDSFEAYMQQFPLHKPYPFMLKGKADLKEVKKKPPHLFSLVFGNEATGLPDEFLDYGESICIRHHREIDSLNLSVAFGIAAYAFSE